MQQLTLTVGSAGGAGGKGGKSGNATAVQYSVAITARVACSLMGAIFRRSASLPYEVS